MQSRKLLACLLSIIMTMILVSCGGGGGGDGAVADGGELKEPIITILGDSTIHLLQGTSYLEPGATAIDGSGQSIDVIISGTVDTSTLGTYTISYSATDSSRNVAHRIRTVTVYSVLPKSLNIAPTISGKPISRILGGETEILEYESGVSVFPYSETDYLVIALNNEDTVEYLGIADQHKEIVQLDSFSTAISLVLMFPSLISAYQLDPDLVKMTIEGDPKVMVLAEVISRNSDWRLMSVAELQTAYGDAVTSVLNSLSALRDEGLTTGVLPSAFHLSPADDISQKSGVTFSLIGMNDLRSADPPNFTVYIENDFARWVSIEVKEKSTGVRLKELDGMPNPRYLAPDSPYFFVSTPSFYMNYESSSIPEEEIIVSAIGPGDHGDFSAFSQDQKNRFKIASIFTLMQEVVGPTIGVITRADHCAKSIFDPMKVTQGYLNKFLASAELEEHILRREYVNAGFESVSLGLEAIQESIASCLIGTIAEEIATRVIPILRELKFLVKTGEAVVKITPFILHANASNIIEEWTLQNSLKTDFSMEGVDYMLAAGYGKLNYTKAEDLEPKWTELYQGDCPIGDDGLPPKDTTCEGYTYDSDGPYRMKFDIECRHPEESYIVPCKRAFFLPDSNLFNVESVEADANGVISFTHDYEMAKEFHGYVETVDEFDAVTSQNLYVQIKKAEPQVVIMQSQVLPMFHESGVLRTVNPYKFPGWGINQQTITETFKFVNRGTGSAIIETVPNSSGPFKVSPDLTGTVIPPLMQVSFDVSYTPQTDSDPNGLLQFSGSLGGDSFGGISDAEGWPEYEYSSIAMEVEPPPYCPDPIPLLEYNGAYYSSTWGYVSEGGPVTIDASQSYVPGFEDTPNKGIASVTEGGYISVDGTRTDEQPGCLREGEITLTSVCGSQSTVPWSVKFPGYSGSVTATPYCIEGHTTTYVEFCNGTSGTVNPYWSISYLGSGECRSLAGGCNTSLGYGVINECGIGSPGESIECTEDFWLGVCVE
ncbi:MAG: DUF5011 domain-containing protein [Desulfuromonadales bacterium]|nr:DUF5011 domain-containing protein [Desulfuromonadales bacterium]